MTTQVIYTRRRLGITGNPPYDGEPFTQFSAVTPETKLEDLNLNWREMDLPERERTKHVHRLHPYLGKFIPQLVEIFLRKYRPTVVCDPFCGSGTALVEANALGIEAVGCDISPFNCLLSRVKTASYDLPVLEAELHDILKRLRERIKGGPQLYLEEMASDYLRTWYTPRARRELLAYRELIDRYRYQDVMRVILSRAARSARLAPHYELDFPKVPVMEPYYCYKHRRICQPTQQALKFLQRYSLDTLRRIQEFAALKTEAKVMILLGDAREVEFPPCDMVITSPPYVGLIDYHEQHRYAFELLGLEERREAEIGAPWKGNSERGVREYIDDMVAAFRNVMRALPKDGVMVVIIHDRRNIYDAIAEQLKVRTEYRLKRHVNRRTGRRADDFFEDVIVWRKS